MQSSSARSRTLYAITGRAQGTVVRRVRSPVAAEDQRHLAVGQTGKGLTRRQRFLARVQSVAASLRGRVPSNLYLCSELLCATALTPGGVRAAEAGSTVPVPVNGLHGTLAIATGSTHSLALRRDGSVWSWGAGTSVPRDAA
jgi:hypothetical protein